jgi:hypothetical protein
MVAVCGPLRLTIVTPLNAYRDITNGRTSDGCVRFMKGYGDAVEEVELREKLFRHALSYGFDKLQGLAFNDTPRHPYRGGIIYPASDIVIPCRRAQIESQDKVHEKTLAKPALLFMPTVIAEARDPRKLNGIGHG